MAGRIGFLPRGFKHITPPDDDDVFDSSLDEQPDVGDEDDVHSYYFSEHSAATVHDRFYADDGDEFDYQPQRALPRFRAEKKNR